MALLIMNCNNLPVELLKGWNCEESRHWFQWDDAVKEGFIILKSESDTFQRCEHVPRQVITDSLEDFKHVSKLIVSYNNQKDGRPKFGVYTRQP